MQATATPSWETTIINPGAIRVNVAERYDVIIDFANYNAGDKLYLTDARSQSVNDTGPPNAESSGISAKPQHRKRHIAV